MRTGIGGIEMALRNLPELSNNAGGFCFCFCCCIAFVAMYWCEMATYILKAAQFDRADESEASGCYTANNGLTDSVGFIRAHKPF